MYLCLTLHKKYFDKIIQGRKRYEFRQYKPHWQKRIEGKDFKYVQFFNGYSKDSRSMKIEFKGYKVRTYKDKKYFVIALGEILSVNNF
jgi:hypothetical protein